MVRDFGGSQSFFSKMYLLNDRQMKVWEQHWLERFPKRLCLKTDLKPYIRRKLQTCSVVVFSALICVWFSAKAFLRFVRGEFAQLRRGGVTWRRGGGLRRDGSGRGAAPPPRPQHRLPTRRGRHFTLNCTLTLTEWSSLIFTGSALSRTGYKLPAGTIFQLYNGHRCLMYIGLTNCMHRFSQSMHTQCNFSKKSLWINHEPNCVLFYLWRRASHASDGKRKACPTTLHRTNFILRCARHTKI